MPIDPAIGSYYPCVSLGDEEESVSIINFGIWSNQEESWVGSFDLNYLLCAKMFQITLVC